MEEIAALYDTQGRPVGSAPRSEVRAKNLHHAATGVIVFDHAGRVFVHRRTLTKDVYPGLDDFTAGGVLQHGEDPWEAAARELFEELGLDATLHRIGEGEYTDAHTSYHAFLGWARTGSEPVLQPEEVLSGEWVEAAELLRRIETEPERFMPDSVALLSPWLREWVEARRQDTTSADTVLVRRALPEDADTVRRLTLAYDPGAAQLPGPDFDLRYAKMLENETHLVLLAECEGEAVGYALAQDYGPGLRCAFSTGRFHDLFVLPEARHRGVGARLVSGVAAWATGRHPFVLDWQASPAAVAFYERLGYTADRRGDFETHPAFCLDTRSES